jgi:hypothetical protein
MIEQSNFVEIFNLYATLFFYLAIGFPLIGGTMLWMAFQLTKVPDFSFARCWKIYLAGLSYSYLVIIGLVFVFSRSFPIVQTALFFAIPMVAIPILSRHPPQRVVVTEIIVVLLANSAMIGLAFVTMPRFSKPSPAAPRQEMNFRISAHEGRP